MKKVLLAIGLAAAVLAGCSSSNSTPSYSPVFTPTPIITVTPVTPTPTPTTTTSPTPTPIVTTTPTPSPTPSVTPTPSPTTTPSSTPSPATALSYTWTASFLKNPTAPQTGPINFFQTGQFATLTVSGGTTPYSYALTNCTTGAGFGPPQTIAQNAGLGSYTVTATNNAGSCNIVITDASNPQKSITVQAITTLTTVPAT